MISQVFLLLAGSCLAALAEPQFLIHPYAAPAVLTSQYHSQDELGQYSYGYAGGPSAKHETKTADGITQGGYSYIDAYGLPQSVSYVSDPMNGFRAAGTNFPVQAPEFVAHPAIPGAALPIAEAVAPADTIEVAAAKAHHFAEKAAAVAKLAHSRRRRALPVAYAAPAAFPVAHAAALHAAPYAAYPYAAPFAYSAPAFRYAAAPAAIAAPAFAAPAIAAPALAYAAAPAPVVAPSSIQHHSQDEFGQYKYGYANQDSAKEEIKTADGITRGSYSYRDSYGLPQTVSYIADPMNGFRAAGTNLPVAPVA